MGRISWKQISVFVLLAAMACTSLSCTVASSNELYFGKTTPPERNIFRYVTGEEPESLDPLVSNGQPEARIYMAFTTASSNITQKHSLRYRHSPRTGAPTTTLLNSLFTCVAMAVGPTATQLTQTILSTAFAARFHRKLLRVMRTWPITLSMPRRTTKGVDVYARSRQRQVSPR